LMVPKSTVSETNNNDNETGESEASPLNAVAPSPSPSSTQPRNSPKFRSKSLSFSPSTARLDTLEVLVVDDSAVITKMVTMLLQRQGHRVLVAENGLEAVQLISNYLRHKVSVEKISVEPDSMIQNINESSQNEVSSHVLSSSDTAAKLTSLKPLPRIPNHIDVILMDFQMPVMSGVEAIRCIRNLEYSSKGTLRSVGTKFDYDSGIPDDTTTTCSIQYEKTLQSLSRCMSPRCGRGLKIIGFSARSDPAEIHAAYDAGMDTFMSKPFTMSSFYETLQTLD
jgi:CheY-like chemotaxis protein